MFILERFLLTCFDSLSKTDYKILLVTQCCDVQLGCYVCSFIQRNNEFSSRFKSLTPLPDTILGRIRYWYHEIWTPHLQILFIFIVDIIRQGWVRLGWGSGWPFVPSLLSQHFTRPLFLSMPAWHPLLAPVKQSLNTSQCQYTRYYQLPAQNTI